MIRLLPSLALKKRDAEQFIDSLKEEIAAIDRRQAKAFIALNHDQNYNSQCDAILQYYTSNDDILITHNYRLNALNNNAYNHNKLEN